MMTLTSLPLSKVNTPEDALLDWDRLYLDLAPRVYNYFRYRLGHDRDAEDLTSRTFEKAWAARGSYRSDLAGFKWRFPSWLGLLYSPTRNTSDESFPYIICRRRFSSPFCVHYSLSTLILPPRYAVTRS
jgi:hypothetical protein